MRDLQRRKVSAFSFTAGRLTLHCSRHQPAPRESQFATLPRAGWCG
jgi:hypothetical protein